MVQEIVSDMFCDSIFGVASRHHDQRMVELQCGVLPMIEVTA